MKKSVNHKNPLNSSALDGLFDSPELVFGIVGPIGVDVDAVVDDIQSELSKVGYESTIIHLTKFIQHPKMKTKLDESTYFSRYKSLIARGNEFRRIAKNKAAVASLGIAKIREIRKSLSGDSKKPKFKHAYILRQFKRPEEIELMRKVYGRKFIQVSISASESERRRVLIDKINSYNDSPKKDGECEKNAIDLINMDHNQRDEEDGQRLSDVFHLGDVFVDGVDRKIISQTICRFVSALFGDNSISPSKYEYGLYIAMAASLRSIDLSRQVGAAIFTPVGEVVSLGCNEVPKSGGGTYWSDDTNGQHRDMELGHDPNHLRKNEIVYDIINRMSDEGYLSSKLKSIKDGQRRVDVFLNNKRIKDSQIMDIIEFGRIIHAEMSAISDAARMGRATKDAILFCTTFPCHLCAKHIVAAGLSKVVFLEPYPKSYAQKLHSDSITFDKEELGKVLFQPFVGISPRRYRDLFEKKKRKDSKGRAQKWNFGHAAPMIEDRGAAYIEYEEEALYSGMKEAIRAGIS